MGGPITHGMTVREILERWPAAGAILAAKGLDLCCGGVHPVSMAAQAHGLDPDRLIAELNAVVAAKAR